jgi:alcohol dehydrogenase (cytochrome c)
MKAMRFLAGLTVLSGVVGAHDWPQWQGPNRNATSLESGLLQEWPASGPALAWRVEGLGGGDSAPAIADGKLFGLSHRDGQEVVWALNEADGEEVWVTPLGAATQQGVPQSSEGPGGTPTVEGDRVYVIGMGGSVACLNVEDGEIVWQRSFTGDFGGQLPMWSYRESPLVDGDQLVCTPGGPSALLVALNKHTGETIWQTPPPAASPMAQGGAPSGGDRPQRPEGNAGNRPDVGPQGGTPEIAGTTDPGLYRSERYGMTAFAREIPNGKYRARLHFAETYAGITAAGQRVFTFSVEGHEFPDFDIWEKADGANKAYVEDVEVEVTDGSLDIAFIRQVENPAIKALEIIPSVDGAGEADAIRINAGQDQPFTDSRGQVWQADAGFVGGQTNPGTLNLAQQGGGRQGGGRQGGGFGGGRGGRGGNRGGAAYSSVIAIDFEGERQYVQLTAGTLLGVAADDGRFLWRYDRAANGMGINCSTPLFEEGLIFAASAYGNGGGAVKLTKDGTGAITAEEVYFSNAMQNHHGGMIVVDGCLYGANGGNEGGFLTCLDFQSGDVLWRDREAPKGALLLADGRLYLRAESGTVILIEPSREEFIERGRFEQPDRSRSPAWAHPVIANGKLYIRDQGLLLCYNVTAG